MVLNRAVPIIGLVGFSLLASLVFARGTAGATKVQSSPPIGVPPDADAMEGEGFVVEPIGWRNVQVTGGTAAQHVTTETALASGFIKIRTDATHALVEGKAEMGFRVRWTATTPPPAFVEFHMDHAVSWTGNSGFVETVPPLPKGLGRVDLSKDQMHDLGSDFPSYHTKIYLVQGPDGKYGGELWIETPSIRVERANLQVLTSAEFSYILTALEWGDPCDIRPRRQPQPESAGR